MPTLPLVQAELTLTANMRQIMDIMKSIAMQSFVDVKKRRSNRFERFTPCFQEFFKLAGLTKSKSPFVQPESATVGVIAITSNESFMAGMNNKILKAGLDRVQGRPSHFIFTGPRMIGRAKQEKIPYTVFPGFRQKNMMDVAVKIKDFVIQKVKAGEFGKILAVFADPVSLSSQEIRVVTMLPAHEMVPKEAGSADAVGDLFQESSIEAIMELLAEFWLTHKLVEMFQDNKMAEYAAQAMQLDGSLQNLTEMQKVQKLLFVKTRREIIDASLRETVTSMMIAPKG